MEIMLELIQRGNQLATLSSFMVQHKEHKVGDKRTLTFNKSYMFVVCRGEKIS